MEKFYNFFNSFKGRNIIPGQRVQVYRNLNKPGTVYSIRDAKTGLILGHASDLLLSGCIFTVYQTGRNKVLRDKKKNVHAWIEGSFGIIHAGDDQIFSDGYEVLYDPYTQYEFELAFNRSPIRSANIVYINRFGVTASGF